MYIGNHESSCATWLSDQQFPLLTSRLLRSNGYVLHTGWEEDGTWDGPRILLRHVVETSPSESYNLEVESYQPALLESIIITR